MCTIRAIYSIFGDVHNKVISNQADIQYDGTVYILIRSQNLWVYKRISYKILPRKMAKSPVSDFQELLKGELFHTVVRDRLTKNFPNKRFPEKTLIRQHRSSLSEFSK